MKSMVNVVISISLEQELLDKLERLMKRHGYSSRSEVFRDAIRRFVSELESAEIESGRVLSVITVVYESTEERIGKRLNVIRQRFKHLVSGDFHMHLDEGLCTEIIIAKGKGEEVAEFLTSIRGIRGMLSLRHVTLSLEEF